MIKKSNIFILFISTFILFSSCNADKDILNEDNYKSKILSVKNIDFNTLLKENRFKNLLNKVTHFSELNKTTFEELNGFTISDGYVRIIETDSVKSYTMFIVRDSITDKYSFENFVIQENKIYNSEKAVIYKYTPSLITSSADDSFVFNGTIQKINLNYNSGSIEFNTVTQNDYCFTDVLMCNQSWSGGLGSGHVAGPNCNNINFLYVIRIKVVCPDNTGLLNNSGGSDSGSSSGIGDSSGGGNNDGGDVSQSPSSNENEIITAPILIGNNNNPFLENPCDKIKDLINPLIGNLKPDIDWLKTKVTEKIEFGVEVKKNMTYQGTFTYTKNRVESIQQYSVPLLVGGNHIGSCHSHPLESFAIPSFGDLKWILDCYDTASSTRKNDVFSMIICKAQDGTINVYALKINDIENLRNGINLIWNDPKFASLNNDDDRLDEIHKTESNRYSKYENDLEKLFLQKYGSFGIDLYKAADDSLNQWNKLELGPNPDTTSPNQLTVIPNPC